MYRAGIWFDSHEFTSKACTYVLLNMIEWASRLLFSGLYTSKTKYILYICIRNQKGKCRPQYPQT